MRRDDGKYTISGVGVHETGRRTGTLSAVYSAMTRPPPSAL